MVTSAMSRVIPLHLTVNRLVVVRDVCYVVVRGEGKWDVLSSSQSRPSSTCWMSHRRQPLESLYTR